MTENLEGSNMIDVSITISGSIDANRLPELIGVIQQLSVVQLAMRATAAGEQLEIPGVDLDPEFVTLKNFRDSYLLNLEPGARPSALPTNVFNKVASQIDADAVTHNKAGEPTAIDRTAFDAFVLERRMSGETKLGPKSKALLFGVARSLPPRPTE